MNKSQLREFAIRSRVALIGSVKLRAFAYGITQDKVKENKVTPSEQVLGTNGKPLTVAERLQRDKLLRQIAQKGFMQVMEEVAYTWFNRFIALRYMENAQLLPIAQRVFVRKDEVRPEILADALRVSLPSLDMQRVIAMLECNENEPLYKLLLLTLCGNLHDILPQMFEKISDYTELLFPDGLLQKDSVLAEMAKLDEDAWQSIQVVGWLYQYYNTELKAETFALLKENVKITKERIGAATQLFTPEWIVRYMVENSLGRLWLEGHRNDTLQGGWKYYLPEAEQEPNVAARLAELRKDAAKLQPEEITVIDPCMGSGHILVAAFDVLMDIYRTAGYTDRDAVPSIIEHNLYGLDIDDRAAQLAYFAVMMKACEYDHLYLSRSEMPQPHVCTIAESNALSAFNSLQGQISLDALCVQTANDLIRTFHDAKEYGSILDVQIASLDSAEQLMVQLHAISQSNFELNGWLIRAEDLLPKLAMQAEIMQRKYDVVVTNPPYMGSGGMGVKLAEFVKDEYPDSKSDLFAVFIEKCGKMLSDRGYQAMITQHAWMFLSSFEKLRSKLQKRELVNMAHLGARAFEEIGGEVVQTTSFVMQKVHMQGFNGVYCRLIEPITQQGKEDMFLAGEGRFVACQDEFAKIPGAPVAYWASEAVTRAFSEGIKLENISHPKKGLATTDNNRFLRLWHEIQSTNIGIGFFSRVDASKSGIKWFPLNKGGEYRRWYGNNEYVVNWQHDGKEMKEAIIKRYNGGSYTKEIRSEERYFSRSISWSALTAGSSSFRLSDCGALFDSAGSSMFPTHDERYIIAALNTKVTDNILKMINPTMNYGAGTIASIPIIIGEEQKHLIENLAEQNIALSRTDWDSFETSWDFKKHPLCQSNHKGIEILAGMKINKQVWIKKLREGDACFSPVNDFITQGEKTDNNEQGDKYEGVFARLHKHDTRINEMRSQLGDDLEELSDGEYILLRRLSCRTIPVFCMYGFYTKDAEIVSQTALPDGSIECRLRFQPSELMFKKFLNGSNGDDNKEIAYGMGFSVGHMQNSIHESLDNDMKSTLEVKVLYDLDFTKEFFIEPTPEYPELQHKAERLSYQKEMRFILLDVHRSDKFILSYKPLSDKSASLFEGATFFDCDVVGHEKGAVLLSHMFNLWRGECDTRFAQLKQNEEELNRIFIKIYGLQDELTPEVADKDVTVRRADLARDIRSLISYAIGCMMGRYSLDVEGLAYAGGDWDWGKYSTFLPDKDGILPIADDEYVGDDIVNRFIQFIEVVNGAKTLEDNLRFIADALGGAGKPPKDVIRSYFLKDFYKDHLKVYQKRPIYWLFDSGNQNGFKALVYLHRYDRDTLARLRTDYVHPQQERLRTQIDGAQHLLNSGDACQRSIAAKRLDKLQKQLTELGKYEEQLHHLADERITLDLDDGVKVNYAKMDGLVAAIK